MGFPAGVQTVVLTGHVGLADGQSQRDKITITPSPPEVVSTSADFIMDDAPIEIVPDRATGQFSIRLLATDSTGINPTGWTYTVARGTRTPYSISLPADTTPVDLSELTPVSADPGVYDLLVPVSIAEAYADTGDAATLAAAEAYTDSHSATPEWVFDITKYGAVGDAQIVHDGAVTGGTATVTCATSTPFGTGLTGKPILIQGAGPSGVTAFKSTITGRTSSSQVTIADTPPTSITSAVVVFGTNSYTAIRAATADAEKYLQGTGTGAAAKEHTYAQVYTPPGAYILDGPLDTSLSGNGQVPLSVYATTAVKKAPHFKGEGSGAGTRHWEQLVPQYGGSCWISFGFYSSTSAQISDINANGNPGIISGPNEGTSNGLAYGVSARFSNIQPMITDMAFLVPHTQYGLPYGAWNFYGCANAHVENVSHSTLGVVAVGSDYASPGTFGTGLSIGALMPAPGNNDLSILRNVSIQGGFTYGIFFSEHTIIDRIMALYCWAGICMVGSYAGSVGAVHPAKVTQASIEQCGRQVYFVGVGSEGVGPRLDIDQLQTESGTPIFDGNSTAALMGAEGRIVLTGLYDPAGVSITQPSGIELVNGQSPAAIRRVTADVTARPIDRTLVCDTTSAGFTATLPDADVNAVTYVMKNVGTNSLTVATTSSQLIYTTSGTGATTATVATGETLRVQAMYNGSSWGWYAI